jgi:hypothetical protein
MGASLTERRRVRDEGFRVVNLFRLLRKVYVNSMHPDKGK